MSKPNMQQGKPQQVNIMDHIAKLADYGVFNHYRETLDIVKMTSIISTYETAQYYIKHALTSELFKDRGQLLKYGIEQASVEGLILEFGVGEGQSLRFLQQLTKQPIYGFDSFDGLPEDWRLAIKKGAFKQDNIPGGFGAHVEIIQGLFEDTLPEFCKKHKEPVRFLHMDCDIYSSTKTVFECMKDQIVPGTIIVFDEYWNYGGWQEHEHKALLEFSETHNKPFEYIGIVRSDLQVAIRFT